jgi:hypothetical protein
MQMAARKPGRSTGRESGNDGTTPQGAAGAGAANGGGAGKGRAAEGAAALGGQEAKGRKATPGAAGKKATTAETGTGAGRARQGAAGAGGAKATPARGAAKAGGNDLQKELSSFVAQHRHGWGHGEWLGLLDRLRQRGVDTSDTERIGRELEKQRLVMTLEEKKISGLGASRVRSVADRFETLYSLRHASVDEIASVSGINRPLAEKVKEALQ